MSSGEPPGFEGRVSRLGPPVLLLGVTAVWGWTFLIVKDAVRLYPVPQFLALRFGIATLLLLPALAPRSRLKDLRVGLLVGLPVAAGYLFQTLGLQHTSAADAGLLTGLFVIFTPLLDWLLYSAPLSPVTVGAALLGLLGTGLLTTAGLHGLNLGDALEILTAVAFALQIVWLGRLAQGAATLPLALGQMAATALIFGGLSAVDAGGPLSGPKPAVWLAILITGTLASALAFWIQSYVQQRMPPSRAAILLLGEPVFATAFAVWLGGEKLSPVQWLGAGLILLSLLSHEVWMALRSHTRIFPAAG